MTAASVILPIVIGVSAVIVSPAIALARLFSALGSNTAFISFGCMLSLLPGRIGASLRTAYYLGTIASIASDVVIGFGSFCSKRTASIGRGTYIGAYCIIGGARIGEKVLVASRVSITSGRHQHGSASGGVDLERGSTFSLLTVGDRTWIGEGAIVMANVGADCIVGAGSVVVSPIPDGSVVAGNPAKPLRIKDSGVKPASAVNG